MKQNFFRGGGGDGSPGSYLCKTCKDLTLIEMLSIFQKIDCKEFLPYIHETLLVNKEIFFLRISAKKGNDKKSRNAVMNKMKLHLNKAFW